jgi:hypothetical protein
VPERERVDLVRFEDMRQRLSRALDYLSAVDPWRTVLGVCLIVNAVAGLSYRVFRLSRGGPRADVTGQAILGAVLVFLAVGVALEWEWPRWAALVYGALFGVIVMPLWTVAVFIPTRPGPVDKAFTIIYWAALALIVIAALAM